MNATTTTLSAAQAFAVEAYANTFTRGVTAAVRDLYRGLDDCDKDRAVTMIQSVIKDGIKAAFDAIRAGATPEAAMPAAEAEAVEIIRDELSWY